MTDMHSSLNSKVVAPPDVLFQETLGEAVLLNLQSGQYFGLDSVGTRMWEVLTAAASLRTACDTLAEEFEVERQRLEADVCQLVDKLAELGLLEVRNG
jgi:hypothetical protein